MTRPAAVSKAPLDTVRIEAVVIGARRRTKVRGLGALQRSIAAHGLIHPILLGEGNQLVAGARRLAACRALGWTTIPARRVDRLTDDELRALELEENTTREALNDFETSKARLAEIRQAEAEASAELRGKVPRNGRGRPGKAGSERDIAERSGMSPRTAERLEQHVALAEQYPFLQLPGWVQHSVLEAGEKLAALSDRDRPKVAALLDQPGIPPKKALEILEKIGAMPAEARREVFAKAKSADPHERGTALALAIQEAPPPDPAALWLSQMHTLGDRAIKFCRTPALVPELRTLLQRIAGLIREFDDRQQEATRRWADKAL